MRKRGKFSDTEMLDWLELSGADLVEVTGGRRAVLGGDLVGSAPHPSGRTAREAIGAAMKADLLRMKKRCESCGAVCEPNNCLCGDDCFSGKPAPKGKAKP